jgi:hypothetical protein
MRKLSVLVAALVLIPATAALAAGGATSAGYGGAAGVQGLVSKSGGSGTLPFTGFSLVAVVVVGSLLVIAGLLMRRGRRVTQ